MPLYRWDIRREVRLQHSLIMHETSLGRSLASDWRACWAGPGLYGLYRHGLLPGVRDIGTAAGILIHVSDRPLNVDEVRFILRHVGYRVTASSIPRALYRAEGSGLYRANWGTYVGRPNSEIQQRAAARAMGFGRRGPVFEEIAARAARQVADALRERRRRLKRGATLSRSARWA